MVGLASASYSDPPRLTPIPLLMVCETAQRRSRFEAAAGTLPMITPP